MNINALWLAAKTRAIALDNALPRGWKMTVLSALLIAVVVWQFKVALSTPLWLLTKLCIGAVVGLWADWMGFPSSRPHLFPAGSPEQQAAWRRRSVIVGAAMVAAGVSA